MSPKQGKTDKKFRRPYTDANPLHFPNLDFLAASNLNVGRVYISYVPIFSYYPNFFIYAYMNNLKRSTVRWINEEKYQKSLRSKKDF